MDNIRADECPKQACDILNKYVMTRKLRVSVYDNDEKIRKTAFDATLKNVEEEHLKKFEEAEEKFLNVYKDDMYMLDKQVANSEEDMIRNKLLKTLLSRKYKAQFTARKQTYESELKTVLTAMQREFRESENENEQAQHELGSYYYDIAFKEWAAACGIAHTNTNLLALWDAEVHALLAK